MRQQSNISLQNVSVQPYLEHPVKIFMIAPASFSKWKETSGPEFSYILFFFQDKTPLCCQGSYITDLYESGRYGTKHGYDMSDSKANQTPQDLQACIDIVQTGFLDITCFEKHTKCNHSKNDLNYLTYFLRAKTVSLLFKAGFCFVPLCPLNTVDY